MPFHLESISCYFSYILRYQFHVSIVGSSFHLLSVDLFIIVVTLVQPTILNDSDENIYGIFEEQLVWFLHCIRALDNPLNLITKSPTLLTSCVTHTCNYCQ